MKYLSCLVVLMFCASLLSAQSPLGVWKTVDDEDGIAKSHIKIFEKDNKLYGKVIGLLPAATVTHCDKCKGDKKGKSLIEMEILSDLEKREDKWVDGKILDPGKGKEYSCQISLDDPNTLKVRGYIGKPIFGRTQYWYRVE